MIKSELRDPFQIIFGDKGIKVVLIITVELGNPSPEVNPFLKAIKLVAQHPDAYS